MVIYDGLHYDALAMGGQKGHSGIVCGWACREGPDPNSLLLPQQRLKDPLRRSTSRYSVRGAHSLSRPWRVQSSWWAYFSAFSFRPVVHTSAPYPFPVSAGIICPLPQSPLAHPTSLIRLPRHPHPNHSVETGAVKDVRRNLHRPWHTMPGKIANWAVHVQTHLVPWLQVRKCHESRQFTDTGNFTLRCGTCQVGVRGEAEAREHAKATGHTNFAEYH